jgi:hypothetical protein
MMEPRYMNQDEIDSVLDKIPRIPSATEESSNHVREELKKVFQKQLQHHKICPDKIEALGNYINNQILNSFINPGENVGMTAGEAYGQPITQMTLNAFHLTGSSKAGHSGLDAYRELLNLSDRRYSTTDIHFRNKDLTFEKLLSYRKNFIGFNINDFLLNSSLSQNIHSVKDTNDLVRPIVERGWWYPIYFKLKNKSDIESTYYLRLKFDINRLYTYSVTLNDISKILEKSSPALSCICSPSNLGIIDIYILPDKIQISLDNIKNGLDKNLKELLISELSKNKYANAIITFIQVALIPGLKNIIICGIPKISNVLPSFKLTLSNIKNTKKLEGNQWYLYFDLINIRLFGIPVKKLKKLLELCDIKIIKENEDGLIIEMPTNPVKKIFDDYKDMSPLQYLQNIEIKDLTDNIKEVDKSDDNWKMILFSQNERTKDVTFILNELPKYGIFPIGDYNDESITLIVKMSEVPVIPIKNLMDNLKT